MKKNNVILLVSVFMILLLGSSLIYLADKEGVFIKKITEKEEEKIQEKEEYSPFLKGSSIENIASFSSLEDFNDYFEKASSLLESGYGFALGRGAFLDSSRVSDGFESGPSISIGLDSLKMPDRYSGTNVQVEGIDEPDIVKTDGISIYFSKEFYDYFRIMPFGGTSEKTTKEGEVKIIKGFPVEELALVNKIDVSGKMLLKNEILVIFSNDKILAYNVNDPKNIDKKWEIKIDEKSVLEGARLYEEEIYLIMRNRVARSQNCLIGLFEIDGNSFNINCTDIHYPGRVIPANSIYTAISIEAKTGDIGNKVSFVGSSDNSIIYLSKNNLYLSYYEVKEIFDFLVAFFEEKLSDIVDTETIDRLKKINEYDISLNSKMIEMDIIMEGFFNSLSSSDMLKFENEFLNRFRDYYNINKRELELTGIVKIGLDNLDIKAIGSVPGALLNQFSMDEYNGNLRVASTIGERMRWWNIGISTIGNNITVNDVYILNDNLETTGEVKDLGLEERIYSVRFLNKMGYVVTFREIDPFYVLDLSNPSSPQMKGELKIPGYSSYLHPLENDKILGIGKEGFNVKVSLFDVSNPYNPKEEDKYILNEYWSEILNNHHAFLLDPKHEIFFLPGGKGGYIFSFNGGKISLVHTVNLKGVKRAIYIDDYLYIISENKIIVLDQNNWETVKELDI